MLIGELLAARELVRLPLATLSLSAGPKGDGRAVVLFPGYSTTDHLMLPLRQFLRSRGHDARGWGLGMNDGDVFGKIGPCMDLVSGLAAASGHPVSVVGWSNGGVFAREIARDRPEAVHRVVTFGTPLNGPPADVAARMDPDYVARIAEEIAARDRRPIEVPVTAIWSRADCIVDWRTCVDELTPQAENIEVSSTHVGMLLDPDIWRITADRLAN